MSGSTQGKAELPTVSVIIAAFSMARWDNLCEAVASVREQTMRALEIVVVIDHNPDLLERASREFTDGIVIANGGGRGASGARNTGVAASHGELVAFLDDDAVASPQWLSALMRHFDNDNVVGVGGRLDPLWATSRPRWFPPEFDWAVGASYQGMPESATPVRNVWSGNMVIRRSVFDTINGFRSGFGKIGKQSRPEDTDLCLRAATVQEDGTWIYEPTGVAGHRVPTQRASLRFFLSRCFHEGQGKAALAGLNGMEQSISVERHYSRRVLPLALARSLREAFRGNASACLRSLAIAMGFSAAAVGFLIGQASAVSLATNIGRPRSVTIAVSRETSTK